MTRTVTMAMAIQFITGKCHIIKQKSYKTALSSYYAYVSHDLLLMASGRTHTYTPTRKQKQFQETRCMWPKAAHAWFKNCYMLGNSLSLR